MARSMEGMNVGNLCLEVLTTIENSYRAFLHALKMKIIGKRNEGLISICKVRPERLWVHCLQLESSDFGFLILLCIIFVF